MRGSTATGTKAQDRATATVTATATKNASSNSNSNSNSDTQTNDASQPTATSSIFSSDSTTSSSSSSSNSPHSGLSTGAKAGIGAGVGGGVLIILGLVTFILLRNRRTNAPNGTPEARDQSMSLMEYKPELDASQLQASPSQKPDVEVTAAYAPPDGANELHAQHLSYQLPTGQNSSELPYSPAPYQQPLHSNPYELPGHSTPREARNGTPPRPSQQETHQKPRPETHVSLGSAGPQARRPATRHHQSLPPQQHQPRERKKLCVQRIPKNILRNRQTNRTPETLRKDHKRTPKGDIRRAQNHLEGGYRALHHGAVSCAREHLVPKPFFERARARKCV
ncbi:hypothetical protein Asppvi_011410 [Aspergillus pseudoviridinutans]|uniref:Uncharacterized protein n=1 Tax=Aspergillus pseudoviridinutans TaxID=1517512 RepID=A0A9P3BP46_9EURO|nr:uncharacterized protein Asppvi_011410 [Aspergillus pseudoviridinutans]GIJ92428.1 hypothetical protein Asppvi_011410 [Aspergillus pseudoviridinutans]